MDIDKAKPFSKCVLCLKQLSNENMKPPFLKIFGNETTFKGEVTMMKTVSKGVKQTFSTRSFTSCMLKGELIF